MSDTGLGLPRDRTLVWSFVMLPSHLGCARGVYWEEWGERGSLRMLLHGRLTEPDLQRRLMIGPVCLPLPQGCVTWGLGCASLMEDKGMACYPGCVGG